MRRFYLAHLFLVAGGIAGLLAAAVAVPRTSNAVPNADRPNPPIASVVEPAHFHHVHLNVVDPDSTLAFYEHFFGANRIRYRDRADALFTERSFILLEKVDEPPRDNFGTSLWHIGWAGVDGNSEFEWRVAQGIGVQTPITPLGSEFYMYFWGPDRELVEVYTGSRNHRFEHVHLLPTDIDATLAWFRDHLGLEPMDTTRFFSRSTMRLNTIRVDNVNLIMFEVPPAGGPRHPILPDSVGPDFSVTEGRAMDHIAFSYADIRPVYERMRAEGVEIVRPIATDEELGLTSFFVRGPDGLLVEIVEEKPVPEGIWR
jgi:catechol 2,3-dioxygenase-like lactoylglutathione lyase family enzyme